MFLSPYPESFFPVVFHGRGFFLIGKSMYSTKHYKEAGITHEIQPIDICRDLSFSLGNAVKYILRAPFKDNPRADLRKAVDYLNDYLVTIKSSNSRFSGLGHCISCRGALALEMYCARIPVMATLFHYNPVEDERLLSVAEITSPLTDDESNDLIQPTIDSVEQTIAKLEEKIELLDKADEEVEVHVREYRKHRRHHRRHNSERN